MKLEVKKTFYYRLHYKRSAYSCRYICNRTYGYYGSEEEGKLVIKQQKKKVLILLFLILIIKTKS